MFQKARLQHDRTLWIVNPDHAAGGVRGHSSSPPGVVIFLQPGADMVLLAVVLSLVLHTDSPEMITEEKAPPE